MFMVFGENETGFPQSPSHKSWVRMAVEWSQLGALFEGVRNCSQSPCMPESCATIPVLSCTLISFQSKLSISFFLYAEALSSLISSFAAFLLHLFLWFWSSRSCAGTLTNSCRTGRAWSSDLPVWVKPDLPCFYSILSLLLLFSLPKCISV